MDWGTNVAKRRKRLAIQTSVKLMRGEWERCSTNRLLIDSLKGGQSPSFVQQLLFERGADPNFDHALHCAVETASFSNVVSLCLAGGNTRSQDSNGLSAAALAHKLASATELPAEKRFRLHFIANWLDAQSQKNFDLAAVADTKQR